MNVSVDVEKAFTIQDGRARKAAPVHANENDGIAREFLKEDLETSNLGLEQMLETHSFARSSIEARSFCVERHAHTVLPGHACHFTNPVLVPRISPACHKGVSGAHERGTKEPGLLHLVFENPQDVIQMQGPHHHRQDEVVDGGTVVGDENAWLTQRDFSMDRDRHADPHHREDDSMEEPGCLILPDGLGTTALCVRLVEAGAPTTSCETVWQTHR